MTINTDIKLNTIELIRKALEDQIKEQVIEKIVYNEMQSFEDKIRPQIKSLVEKLTIQKIENLSDLRYLRDELHVFIHWKEDK